MFDIAFMISTVPEIIKHLPITLLMAFVSCFFGLVLGLFLALARFFKVRGLNTIVKVYVSFIRGTPMLVQLYLVYYGIPLILRNISEAFDIDIDINSIPAIVFAFFAFSLNSAAYMSETIRSAIEAVDSGQLEACYSVHLTTAQAMRRIILPQAFAIALPPLGNSLLSLVKDTSLAFSISVVDVMAGAKIVGSRSFRFFEVYIVVSVIYWIACIIIEQCIALIERRMRHFEKERH